MSVYGISEVFVFPHLRGEGFGKQVVQAAGEFLLSQGDGDLAILFCREHLRPFYSSLGWTEVSSRWVCAGNPDAPTFLENRCVFFLVLSDQGRDVMQGFEQMPLYLGSYFW